MSHLLVDTLQSLFEYVVVENFLFFFTVEFITVIHTLYSFGHEIRLWAVDEDLLLLPVLSAILKMYK